MIDEDIPNEWIDRVDKLERRVDALQSLVKALIYRAPRRETTWNATIEKIFDAARDDTTDEAIHRELDDILDGTAMYRD